MSLRLNGSTSGYTELDAGAVAGNNTIKMPTSNGSAYQVLRNGATAGTTEFGGAIVSGTAVASTSGTSIDFTGIPSWVKRVTVMFNGVSTNGTSLIQSQIGAGSFATSGYVGAATSTTGTPVVGTSTTGFPVQGQGSASASINAQLVLTNISGNIWIAAVSGLAVSNTPICGGGTVTLSGTLDRIRITTVNGTDQFDAGTINILYE